MAHGASMGLSHGVTTLIDELAEVKPTLLYAVPQLFKRVCDAVHAKVCKIYELSSVELARDALLIVEYRDIVFEGAIVERRLFKSRLSYTVLISPCSITHEGHCSVSHPTIS